MKIGAFGTRRAHTINTSMCQKLSYKYDLYDAPFVPFWECQEGRYVLCLGVKDAKSCLPKCGVKPRKPGCKQKREGRENL